jgi:hypothetical protein
VVTFDRNNGIINFSASFLEYRKIDICSNNLFLMLFDLKFQDNKDIEGQQPESADLGEKLTLIPIFSRAIYESLGT